VSDERDRSPGLANGERHESRTGNGGRSEMEQLIGRKERRHVWARRTGDRSMWFGVGMFGVVGWSVAVPTVAGIAVGLWIDSQSQSGRSWTLMLMVAGLGMGCWNAWNWIHRESSLSGCGPDDDLETKSESTRGSHSR
jgi:ATP synthase protein I